jgi:predicted SAM-dependent methyltransferase
MDAPGGCSPAGTDRHRQAGMLSELLHNRGVQHKISRVIRGRRLFMRRKRKGLILDIGCGPQPHHDNLNLDYYWRPGVDICCDVTRGLPLSDAYVGGIYSEHCLEHIPLAQARRLLCECHRVLEPGAYLRLIVPDFGIYLQQYLRAAEDGGSMPYASDDVIEGFYSPVMSINRIFRSHGHQFIYDFTALGALLQLTGFSAIRRCAFGVGSDPRLLLDSPERQIESLYVEARKSPAAPAF